MERFTELTKNSDFLKIQQDRGMELAENVGMEIAKKIGFRQISKRQAKNLAFFSTYLFLLGKDRDLDNFVRPFFKKHLN